MKITEIFHSIQGEGPNVGKPTVFVRLAGCNLKCSWCDSKYSWNEGKEMFVELVAKEIRQFNCDSVCITGGEPLLQRAELEKLINKLYYEDNYNIEVETNGTIMPPLILFDIHYNVSPKFNCIKQDILYNFDTIENAIFKFVIASSKDIDTVEDIIAEIGIRKDKVYLMPLTGGLYYDFRSTTGYNVESLNTAKWLWKECIKRRYNFSPRLHTMIFGNGRGI